MVLMAITGEILIINFIGTLFGSWKNSIADILGI